MKCQANNDAVLNIESAIEHAHTNKTLIFDNDGDLLVILTLRIPTDKILKFKNQEKSNTNKVFSRARFDRV